MGIENCPSAVLDVGLDLSSRTVSREVLSTLVSLTSVFGMGTGGPSPFIRPTLLAAFLHWSLKIEQQSLSESLVKYGKVSFDLYHILHRKEVIQPHLPIRLPCYDLTPIIEPTLGSYLTRLVY